MDNNKNSNQVNNTDTKPSVTPPTDMPVEQNNSNGNPTPQEPYTTYSSIPNIFNHNPAVSQNRNIPSKPMPNGGQQVRPPMPNGGQQVRPPMPNGGQQVRPPMPNGGQQVRPPMPNGGQQVRKPMQNSTATQQQKRPSEGRAFAQEFYSQTMASEKTAGNPQTRPQQPIASEKPGVNPQVKPQQPIASEKPAVNPQVKPQQPIASEKPGVNPQVKPQQSIASEKPGVNPQAKPQQPIDYSKPMQTTPDINTRVNPQPVPQPPFGNNPTDDNATNTPKRDIKYNYKALTPPDKKSTSIIIAVYVFVIALLLVGVIGYAISIGGSSGFKESYSNLFDKFDIQSVFSDDDSYSNYPDFSDSDFNNDVYSAELTYTDEYSTEQTVTLYSPTGYEYDWSLSNDDLAVFFDELTGVTCEAWLATGNIDNINELYTQFVNPDNEDYLQNNTVEYYQTSDFEAYIEKIDFHDREQLFAFAEVGDEVLLIITATKDISSDYAEDIDEDTILVSVEEMLDRVRLY